MMEIPTILRQDKSGLNGLNKQASLTNTLHTGTSSGEVDDVGLKLG